MFKVDQKKYFSLYIILSVSPGKKKIFLAWLQWKKQKEKELFAKCIDWT